MAASAAHAARTAFLLTFHNPSDMIDLGVRGRRQIKT